MLFHHFSLPSKQLSDCLGIANLVNAISSSFSTLGTAVASIKFDIINYGCLDCNFNSRIVNGVAHNLTCFGNVENSFISTILIIYASIT